MIYADEQGRALSTHSMLKTFRRCPKQAEFKYVMRLKPKVLGRPLKRGSWIHELLEVHHGGGDWKERHAELTEQFDAMFDEEKEDLGDLPRECRRLMQGYVWHYGDDDFKVKEVEFTVETEFPDGSIYRGKVDALVEWRKRLYLVDHKTHKTLPNLDFRLLDAQSALYLWACQANGIKVEGFIWNYIRTKAPSIPQAVYGGTRLSKRACDTDYPTLYKAIKAYGLRHADYADWLNRLKGQRFEPGKLQTSEFFRRDVLEKSPEMIARVAAENFHTSIRMHSYSWEDKDSIERVVDRSCTFSCSYTDICSIQLMGGNIQPLIRQRYKVGDPMDYYQDRAGDHEKRED